MRALSQNNDDPAHASRPFDRDRDGFIVGEARAFWFSKNLSSRKKEMRPFSPRCRYG